MIRFDKLITSFDTGLRSLLPPEKRLSQRPNPAINMEDTALSQESQKHVAGLMRVNHSGEVCAQALYQGQALTAKLSAVKMQMQQAAAEEMDHLAWCEARLQELNSQPSILNPVWYLGSFMMGALAGLAGDKWSLGFVVETERQVTNHLAQHLNQLPLEDNKTRAILKQMQEDETEHAEVAVSAGAASLPFVLKTMMRYVSKLMTKSSYYF